MSSRQLTHTLFPPTDALGFYLILKFLQARLLMRGVRKRGAFILKKCK